MDIQSVKEFNSYYLVNGSTTVPKNKKNRDYRSVQCWLEDGGVLTPLYSVEELKDLKKQEIKKLRNDSFSKPLLARVISGDSYYVTTNPEINIFQSAILMTDDETREWGCYRDGQKEIITLTKSELLSLANHYEQRKNQEYNLCDKRREAVDALSTIQEVEDYDINTVEFD